MTSFIWTWLVVLHNWFYMKPFCFERASRNGGLASWDKIDGKRDFVCLGINFPRGWRFLHITFKREDGNTLLHFYFCRSVR